MLYLEAWNSVIFKSIVCFFTELTWLGSISVFIPCDRLLLKFQFLSFRLQGIGFNWAFQSLHFISIVKGLFNDLAPLSLWCSCSLPPSFSRCTDALSDLTFVLCFIKLQASFMDCKVPSGDTSYVIDFSEYSLHLSQIASLIVSV